MYLPLQGQLDSQGVPLTLSTFLRRQTIRWANGRYCYLSAARIKNREVKPELQILLSFNKPEEAVNTYKMR